MKKHQELKIIPFSLYEALCASVFKDLGLCTVRVTPSTSIGRVIANFENCIFSLKNVYTQFKTGDYRSAVFMQDIYLDITFPQRFSRYGLHCWGDLITRHGENLRNLIRSLVMT